MPTIKVSDLQPAGYDLLSDSESYMMDLTEDELEVQGGIWTSPTLSSKVCIGVVVSLFSAALSISAANSQPGSPHKPPVHPK